MALPAEKEHYTFADILAWDEDKPVELIDGAVLAMNTPSTDHQLICGEMFRQLANYLEGKKCQVISAPYAVRLFEKDGDCPEDVDTVVQPDLSVVCDRGKLDKTGCKGAPDMVVEVLSPSTQRHDRLVKLNLYQRAGVREYWIVDPDSQTVQVMLQDSSGSFQLHEVYDRAGIAKVDVLDGCFIELGKVFAGR